ncbi:PREDICTED: uncharacterized protein LOC108766760 [Trachymyrmex cornetzi]|uniref:uncharacterized protein LOC108766760 n=1 Tax=Trachymyrmex cornetzi TaxID=471704 RepID=UPI00084F7B54|nr:PREDICTED: uncharacterized protein LOC108766760 [Trachymyrmex cornetzi]
MSFKAYMAVLISEMYNDEDDEVSPVETYKHFFAKRGKKRKIMTLLNTNERQHHNRPELYSEFWIDLYTEYDFFLIFRMKQSTFQNLLQIIMQQQEMQRAFTGGFESVLPQKIQQIAIYYLANQISMAQIGDKFNVASSTVFNCIKRGAQTLT